MRTLNRALAVLSLLAAPLATAQQTAQLCQNSLDQDVQPNFANLDLSNGTIALTADQKLKLETNRRQLNPENISFPFDQNITISYVYEEAAASHALGYLYVDDLRRAGYVNATGELVDSNANGILDLHEDMYNLAPPDGAQTRNYIGLSRRCNRTFVSGGMTYSQPDLAMNSGCGDTFSGAQSVVDARPVPYNNITVDLVGNMATSDAVNGAFSDNGLFPHIPNLLEPAAVANGNKGLGKMVFLLSDDDSGRNTFRNLAPVRDEGDYDEGIPDYDVSRYDQEGLERATNPNPGISAYDRTVDLGTIGGGREVVFFLVTFFSEDVATNDHNIQPGHDTFNLATSVYPCLKMDAAGQCLLHLRTPIKVFFTKAGWNMDQNPKSAPNVAERNIGCGHANACTLTTAANRQAPACRVGTTTEWACGWLDTQTLARLRSDELYGNLDMPREKVVVPRPAGVRNAMPHVIVGAPTTDPFRWILGFEDIPGGGDRDFNDVVFVINKQNGGTSRSATVSGDISPDLPEDARDFVITKVRFRRQDDTTRVCNGRSPCWSEDTAGACTPSNGTRPSINYSLAVDCRLWSETNRRWEANPAPQWFPVDFGNATPARQEVEVDVLAMGFTGSQLCWKVDIVSPNEACRPVIDNVDVGYQAVRTGNYSRASPSTLGNAIVWGVNETPGRTWGSSWPGDGMPAATVRAYDDRKDVSLRGRTYLRSLYDPESTNTTRIVQRWDGGRALAEAFLSGMDPLTRKLYTLDANGARTEVKLEAEDGDSNSPLFPDALCDRRHDRTGSNFLWDLNRDGRCGTPSITVPEKRVTGVTNDRNFFVEWLYGWEDRHAPGPSDVKRPWPMGGVNMSTVAVAVPPYLDTWALNTLPAERDLYRENFMKALENRRTIAYVGTMSGALHAFNSGEFRNEATDPCATGSHLRGLFRIRGTQCTPPITPRQYGSGAEEFAYLPRLLLPYYRNLYVPVPDTLPPPKPQIDASPTIANVDFRGLTNRPDWTPSTSASKTQGAKTVLVSATGKGSSAVFALDITDPTQSWYPLPLWEFDMKDPFINVGFSVARALDPRIELPDDSGSRHAPSVARLAWGNNSPDPGMWTAVVGTDMMPNDTTRAGALYLIDMKTGRPLNYGSSLLGIMAGVITLDRGFGVAAETALVDLNRDGNYDVMYVPTTMGNVYRINLDKIDVTRPLGRKVKTCLVASAPETLDGHRDAAPVSTYQNPVYQQIHSNLGVKVIRSGAEPKVQFFFGTSDNPDLLLDGPRNASDQPDKSNYIYHLLGFEDPDPRGEAECELLDPMWVQKLHPGQSVWGGVSLTAERVFATTAVGASADICNLSRESGRLYDSGQRPTENGPPDMTSALLQGHGISAPVVHDQHLFVLTATGEMKMMGDDKWNNGSANSGASRTRVLIYDPNPEGRLPK